MKSGARNVQRWYYWYRDAATGKQVSKVCKGCRTKQQAVLFVAQLEPPVERGDFRIGRFARDMFTPGSEYCTLQKQLGREVSPRTLLCYARRLENVTADFGGCSLRDLSTKKIIDRLAAKDKSASWKNQYLHVIRELYSFANYNGAKLYVPHLPLFKGAGKKSDIFTFAELSRLLVPDNFSGEVFYYLFLLTLSAGLRSGEARAFRPCQILRQSRAIIIDGFLGDGGRRTNYNKAGGDEDLKWRVIPLPLFTFEKITAYVTETGCADGDFLFKANGKPIASGATLKEIRRGMEKARIDAAGRKLTCHSLRYTYITHMRSLLSGDDVRKIAGHNSMEMTEYYTRASLEGAALTMQPLLAVVDKFFTKLPSTDNLEPKRKH